MSQATSLSVYQQYDCGGCDCEETDCDDFEIFVSAETEETCVPECVLENGAIYKITISGTFEHCVVPPTCSMGDGMYGSIESTPQMTSTRRFFYSTNGGDNWEARPDQGYNPANTYNWNVSIPSTGTRTFCFRLGSTGWENNTGGLTVRVEKQP